VAATLTPRVVAVVLAAGAGRRFGGGKLVAALRGRPLLQSALDAACGARALACVLVIGAGGEQVIAAVDTRRCSVVVNRAWERGISSSIAQGLRAERGADACIFVLGDQPFVSAGDLDRLIAAWERRPDAIIALRNGDTWGAPMLFPRRDFARLRALTGDVGAKRYTQGQRGRLTFVDALDPAAFEDVDTRAALSRLNEGRTRRIPRSRPL
jgi:molybdenum cofactor cytidylyltransferase